MKRIVRRFFNAKLSIKIILYYLTTFLLLVALSFFSFDRINTGMTNQKVNQLSAETVNSLKANLDFLVGTVNNQSKMLISSTTLQSVLCDGGRGYNLSRQKTMDNYLSDFTNFYDAISSIYIFDALGHQYYVDNLFFKNLSLQKIEAASWYPELLQKKGGYLLKLNAGGTFDTDGKNTVSLIRQINDLNTQKPIGVMVINISEDYINASFEGVTSVNNTKVMLNDEYNQPIIHTNAISNDDLTELTKGANARSFSQIHNIDGTSYIISSVRNGYHWTIATVTPIDELARKAQTYNVFLILAILISFLMLAVGLLFTSLFVTRPIKKLAKAMDGVKNGRFQEVRIRTGADEIGMLQDVYNLMVGEIKKLFNNILLEQKQKRKAELEALQAQIKPHFLYNSFDAISSLALSGENRKVYSIVKALGKFYRSFLNTDSEQITVGEELEMIRQYLTIQLIRFQDTFTVDWQIDEQALCAKLPRLTLQPIVENAIKHGLRGKPGNGLLTICVKSQNDTVELVVRDNGDGMDEAGREKLLSGDGKGSGFKITRERLNLFYNTNAVFSVKTAKGEGCEVTIRIPA